MKQDFRVQLKVLKPEPKALLVARIPMDWDARRITSFAKMLDQVKDQYGCSGCVLLPMEVELAFMSEEDLAQLGLRRVSRIVTGRVT